MTSVRSSAFRRSVMPRCLKAELPTIETPMQDFAFNRRVFLKRTGFGLGTMALASLLGDRAAPAAGEQAGLPNLPHFKAKAKRVIYLFQSGAPSQLDLFDAKPDLK